MPKSGGASSFEVKMADEQADEDGKRPFEHEVRIFGKTESFRRA
jgi:hypothetical protein